jgi:predicted alpha/beta-hydrolase family hydrolase
MGTADLANELERGCRNFGRSNGFFFGAAENFNAAAHFFTAHNARPSGGLCAPSTFTKLIITVARYLHQPEKDSDVGLVLTHGAGGNARAPFLVSLAEAFCSAGWWVLRCDMAFRERAQTGPPRPASSALDRDSLRDAVSELRKAGPHTIVLGGHSYGGRQSTMLAEEDPALVKALLLCSYPLHPPGKPNQPRTAHFPALQKPSLFVHGTKDPFGTIEELTAALTMIPAKTELVAIEGAGHDLKRGKFDLKGMVVERLRALIPA